MPEDKLETAGVEALQAMLAAIGKHYGECPDSRITAGLTAVVAGSIFRGLLNQASPEIREKLRELILNLIEDMKQEVLVQDAKQ